MSRKVLLVNPHDTKQGNYHPAPTGILYLHAMLRKHGVQAEWIDGNLWGFDSIKEKIDSFKPDLVGVSMMTPGRHKALEVVRYAKGKGTETIIGGAHSSLMGEQLLKNYPEVDCACRGEGEYTILALAQGARYASVPNLMWRNGQELAHTTEPQFSLNDIPYPSWDTVPWAEYNRRHAGPRVIFTRGCSWGKCVFCSVGVQKSTYRVRDPQNLVGELQWLKQLGQPNIAFADDTMNGNLEALKALMRLMIESQVGMSFYATMRVDNVDEELLRLMKQAGCYEISYGVEVGEPEALKIYCKGATIEQAEWTMRKTQEAGIRPCALIIYKGFQWQRVDPITRGWLNRIQTVHNVGSVDGLWVLPGTPLYRAMKAHGFIDDSFWLGPEPYMIYAGQLDHLTARDWAEYH